MFVAINKWSTILKQTMCIQALSAPICFICAETFERVQLAIYQVLKRRLWTEYVAQTPQRTFTGEVRISDGAV